MAAVLGERARILPRDDGAVSPVHTQEGKVVKAALPEDPGEDEELNIVVVPHYEAPSTALSVFSNLTNISLGPAILTVSEAYVLSGVGFGPLLFLGMFVSCAYTMWLLARTAEHTKDRTFQEIVDRCFPRAVSACLQMVVVLGGYGIIIGLVVVVGDLLSPLVQQWFPESQGEWYSEKWAVETFVCAFVIFPLALLPTLDTLKYVSVVVIFAVFAFCAVIVYASIEGPDSPFAGDDDDSGGPDDGWGDALFRFHYELLISVSLISNMLGGHFQSTTLYSDMRPGTRSVRTMTWVTVISYSLCALIYNFVGVFGFPLLEGTGDTNLLAAIHKDFPDDKFVQIASGSMVLAAVLSYPLMSWPTRVALDFFIAQTLRLDVQSFVISWRHWTWSTLVRYVVCTFVMVAVSLIMAAVIEDLSVIFSLIGATGGVMVKFLLPPIMYIIVFDLRSVPLGWDATTAHKALLYGVFFGGLALSVSGVTTTLYNAFS